MHIGQGVHFLELMFRQDCNQKQIFYMIAHLDCPLGLQLQNYMYTNQGAGMY